MAVQRVCVFCGSAITEGFVHLTYRALVVDDDEPVRLLQRLAAYEPPTVVKWMDRDEI